MMLQMAALRAALCCYVYSSSETCAARRVSLCGAQSRSSGGCAARRLMLRCVQAFK
ncbi:hypothetical protein A2U01_0056857, partial [Trifolium medium]|nr:hypothetical protein [Trifolium medium]